MYQPASKNYQDSMQKERDFEAFRNKLKLRNIQAKNSIFEKYPEVKKFFEENNLSFEKIAQYSSKVLATGALTGALVFTPPTSTNGLPSPTEIVKSITDIKNASSSSSVLPQVELVASLGSSLPVKVGSLDRSQEKYLEVLFKNIIGINAKASLEGEHLNTTYGIIGLEQNLARYPGDITTNMAPGRGAWGYFAKSKSQLTNEDTEREKWYAVVQTLYLPDWEERLKYLRDWYKYRKILIVNTENGNAVVADIADSGPAAWTGKQFGGSPEVMQALGGIKYTKGKVVVFFVDDPENKVPLGPVDYSTNGIAAKS